MIQFDEHIFQYVLDGLVQPLTSQVITDSQLPKWVGSTHQLVYH